MEPQSLYTAESAGRSYDLIAENWGWSGVKKIMVIDKSYHLRRGLMSLKKHFPDKLNYCYASYTVYNITKDNWFKSELRSQKVLAEYHKIRQHLAAGKIDEIRP